MTAKRHSNKRATTAGENHSVSATRAQLSNTEDPRAVRSQQALRLALMRLLKIKSLDQITIRDIAAKAGVGYATFFRHHSTKEALLNEIAAEEIRSLFSLSVSAMGADDVVAGSMALFSYVGKNRQLWSTLLTGGASGTIRDEFLRQAREVAARAKHGSWIPAEIGTVLAVSGTIELLSLWLRQSDPLPIKHIAAIHARTIVSPIMVAAASPPP